ncbi:MAG: energy-coupling factor transporter transmembrane protein EcfT [Clostridia bacterium]|nr:energy-coupling factor transporter transmembrane protein EcfT [Clostridia bacterium]
MTNIFNYIDRKSPIHNLTGATKFVCLLLWSFAAMVTFDTKILALLPVVSFILFGLSKIKLKDISFLLVFTLVFMVMNNVLVFLFSPMHGTELYGSCTEICKLWGNNYLTVEQLWYHLNLVLKYFSTMPIVILFISTTEPSEFAASLNKIGVKYTIAYAVSLALRYIPDVQREYHEISLAQQARGIEMSSKENIVKRLKSASAILIPLVLQSLERIDVITNAMELRGFGKNRKRTWYRSRKFTKADIISMIFCGALLLLSIGMNIYNGSRFWMPHF